MPSKTVVQTTESVPTIRHEERDLATLPYLAIMTIFELFGIKYHI